MSTHLQLATARTVIDDRRRTADGARLATPRRHARRLRWIRRAARWLMRPAG
jgi:hypothetical protein